MQAIEYVGERLWAGQLGHVFVTLSFVAALLSFISFWLSTKDVSFIKLARISFFVHGFSVIGIAGTLFFMLFNHFFEYQYVWQHSNTDMSMKYILSCFWEGQEGSFLLWTFWNVVLGLLLNRQLRGTTWEAPVMSVFLLVQVFLASMILGIYIGEYRLGSSPFLLLREHPEFSNLPMVQVADYVKSLDGRGLNPLLMNYWMTIHPPTLFLGFASTLVPFSFAIGALYKKEYTTWQRVALPWTYFSVMILGVGILMGGAWAYEALSFGGFWAWDPVENSSLVPWLVVVGAAHTMIINRNKGGSLFTTHFLSITAFLLVLYSTFLTRSGVLGNASVHAFTDLGMTGQLVLYVLTFVFISASLLITDKLFQTTYIVLSILMLFAATLYGHVSVFLVTWIVGTFIITIVSYFLYFPKESEEEDLYSREFWMFIGALVLVIAALIITYFTSIPVINKLFGTDYAPPKVPVYNKWMLPFAIIIMLLIGASQFLKYKSTDKREFFKKVMYSFIAALGFGLACGIPLYFLQPAENEPGTGDALAYGSLLICGFFGVFANGDYWIRILKGKVKKAGASIAHIGFALLIVGALISTSKKVTLSKNTSQRQVSKLGADFDDRKSILLTQGDTLPMGPYLVTYTGKTKEGINVLFHVDYMKKNKEGKPEYEFTLVPRVQDNPRMGKAPEPDTRHYADRDIYTHVTWADLTVDTGKIKDGFGTAKNYIGHVGDTIFASNAIVVIDSLRTNLSRQEYEKNDSLLEVTAVLRALNINAKTFYAYPRFVISNNVVIPREDVIEGLGLKFVFWKINPTEGTIEITMSEKNSNTKDFFVMEAYVFPYINVLWIGCLVMALGTGIAIIERIRKFKQQTA
jgi:cytochrome c-type biogenesis protein CcmF